MNVNNDFLQFIGTGSAFNNVLGNNSAFIKNNEHLLLIDCGGDVFHKLLSNDLLLDITSIDILITHLHPDHVGSLGDLVFYNYYYKNMITNIHYIDDDLCELLSLLDINKDFYKLNKSNNFIINNLSIKRIKQVHRGQQDACGYLMQSNNFTMFYSGDSKTIPEEILSKLINGEIDILYQDVSTNDFIDNPHLSLSNLIKIVDEKFRHKVVCMHLDAYFNENEARKLGFSVAKSHSYIQEEIS